MVLTTKLLFAVKFALPSFKRTAPRSERILLNARELTGTYLSWCPRHRSPARGELIAADAEVSAAFANLPSLSLMRTKGTRIGALHLDHFLPSATRIDEKDCSVHNEFPKHLQKPMEDLVDALLYLGPQDLAMKEQFPAYIALDADYMTEVRRRESLLPGGGAATDKEFYQRFVNEAENPLFTVPKPVGPKGVQAVVQSCLDRKSHGSTSKPEHRL